MKKVLVLFLLLITGGVAFAGVLCDEGYDKYGNYSRWLNCRNVEGKGTRVLSGYSSLHDELKGQVKSIRKDPGTGNIHVERYGEGTTVYTEMNGGRYEPTLRY